VCSAAQGRVCAVRGRGGLACPLLGLLEKGGGVGGQLRLVSVSSPCFEALSEEGSAAGGGAGA
jgi:hypothetical protein